MKKQISREDRIYRFRLMLVLTFVALLAVAALITFSFLCVEELELLIMHQMMKSGVRRCR